MMKATPSEETAALPVVLPGDAATGQPVASEERRGMLWRWMSIAAAALLHIAVLLWLLFGPTLAPVIPAQPNPIPVTLVLAPPPEPQPQPVARPPAPAPPPSPALRESGKDAQTTAPPPAEAPAPEVMAPPPATTEPEPPKPEPAPAPAERPAASAKPVPAPRHAPEPAPARPPAREKEAARAPRPAPQRSVDIRPGDKEQTGDPYLNAARDRIEQHRTYPPLAVPLGLDGTAIYDMLVDRNGALRALRLRESSGARILDETAERMIRDAAPFPPLPPSYPGEAVSITVAIRLFPG